MSRYSTTIYVEPENWTSIADNCSKSTAIKFPPVGKYKLAYGLDHAMGWFMQLFPLDDIAETAVEDLMGFPGAECIDFDSMFDSFSGAELGFILKLFGGNEEHANLAYLDYEF
jgi:hypothetical protein